MTIAFEAIFPGTPLGVRAVRREMTGFANDCGMDAEGIAAVRLAVTEAATNVVMHAYADAHGELRVTAAIRDGELTIVIGDTGRGLVNPRDSPGLGAGLAIISSVVQGLKILSDARGTEIQMAFPCPNAV